jgi:hypothetical protein
MTDLDEAAVAAVELVGRTGATGFELGYLHDNVPVEEAAWYAHAQFRGARITAENHPGPVEACEALARRLLSGGQCKCGRLVAMSDDGAFAYRKAHLVNGGSWTAEDAQRAGQCQWRRIAQRWTPGCEVAP